MRKALILALVIAVALAFIGTALAVPPGKTVEFKDGKMGKVIFDGKKHANAGMKCSDCHPKVFKMKKGADKITMKDIYAGKFCGTCHNGKKAFKPQTGCKKCHHKKRKVIKGC
ncbi:MAG TPA: cytochrome C [Nitrospirae bacterium]|nr:cytochrome C [Nitrospirota bacterium]